MQDQFNLANYASIIVLAGGNSTRMGYDKSQMIFERMPLLETVLNRVYSVAENIIVVTGKRDIPELAKYKKVTAVKDIFPGMGAMGGIYTGLYVSENKYNFVTGCDMPFLNKSLIKYLLKQTEGFDIVLPRLSGLNEPLHAVYSKKCLESIEYLLAHKNLKIIDLIKLTNVKFVELRDIKFFDPDLLSFFNINTHEDLEKANRAANY